MVRFRKLAHVIWECKYHLVCCPRYRYRVLESGVRRTVDTSPLCSDQKDCTFTIWTGIWSERKTWERWIAGHTIGLNMSGEPQVHPLFSRTVSSCSVIRRRNLSSLPVILKQAKSYGKPCVMNSHLGGHPPSWRVRKEWNW